MSTEKQPTATELLAEWQNWKDVEFDRPLEKSHKIRMEAIATQLDKMCEDIEMNHSDGSVHILQCGLNWWQNPDNIDDDDIAEIEIKKFEAQRMQNLIALLQWLLIKAQDGK